MLINASARAHAQLSLRLYTVPLEKYSVIITSASSTCSIESAPLHSPARETFRYLLHQGASHVHLSLRLYTVPLEKYSVIITSASSTCSIESAPLHSPAREIFRYLLHQRAAHVHLSLRLYTVPLEKYSGNYCISEQHMFN